MQASNQTCNYSIDIVSRYFLRQMRLFVASSRLTMCFSRNLDYAFLQPGTIWEHRLITVASRPARSQIQNASRTAAHRIGHSTDCAVATRDNVTTVRIRVSTNDSKQRAVYFDAAMPVVTSITNRASG